jgi:hypothetical protein
VFVDHATSSSPSLNQDDDDQYTPARIKSLYDREAQPVSIVPSLSLLTLLDRLNHSTQISPPTPLMSNTGSNIDNDIKGAVKGIHGADEAIRGTFNQAVDTTFSDKAGEARNKAVAERGIKEVEAADRNFGTGHGVKIDGVTNSTTTSARAHSGAIGNM